MMINWDSHNPTPPALLYPPEGQKWHPRRDLPATTIVTAPNGKVMPLLEKLNSVVQCLRFILSIAAQFSYLGLFRF